MEKSPSLVRFDQQELDLPRVIEDLKTVNAIEAGGSADHECLIPEDQLYKDLDIERAIYTGWVDANLTSKHK